MPGTNSSIKMMMKLTGFGLCNISGLFLGTPGATCKEAINSKLLDKNTEIGNKSQPSHLPEVK